MTPHPQQQGLTSKSFVIHESELSMIIDWLSYRRYEDSDVDSFIDRVRSRPRPAPAPDKGCHWYKENNCTKEEWLNEWERRAGPTQITLTSELPTIIPPLPKGDTKDLKTWKEYWKQHDATIRNQTLDNTITKIQSLNIAKGMRAATFKQIVIESLRTQSTKEQAQ